MAGPTSVLARIPVIVIEKISGSGGGGRRARGALAHPFPDRVLSGHPPPRWRTLDRECIEMQWEPQPGKREAKPMRRAGRKNCSTHA